MTTGKPVLRRKVREGPRSVSRRGDDQALDAVLPGVLEHHGGLELLEGAGLEQRPLLWPVAVESDEELLEAEMLRKTMGTVHQRSRLDANAG